MAYVYEMPPTDDFAAFQTPADYISRCRAESSYEGEDAAEEKAITWLDHCRDLVRQHTSWDGEIRVDGTGPSEGISALPTPMRATPYLIYVLKQHHNGTTFVVSDMQLPDAANYLVHSD